MKPKDKRDRLFRSGKPNVRTIEVIDNDGTWGRDMAVLWAAYKAGSFDELPEGLSQDEFAREFANVLSTFHHAWIVEDRNSKYRSRHGPVMMIAAVYNGWEVEPHMEKFSWATTRNTLRSIVAFLQMLRYRSDVGVVLVHSLKHDKRFFRKVAEYGVLNYVGRIPNGDIRGDRHIFYVRGKKERR